MRMDFCRKFVMGGNVKWFSVVVVIALLWSSNGRAAETEVYLLRGWFGIFSTGLDGIAEQLQAKGVKTEVLGHLAWKSTLDKIIQERAAGKNYLLVLVGHSQGANNIIDVARALEPHDIKVDLLVTLAPFMQDNVPANVVRAVNYYQSPGWGEPLTADPGFHGKLSNINVEGDLNIVHTNIDKNPKVQADIVRDIIDLSQSNNARPRPGNKRI
jgi:hypothetical protein